MTQPPIVPLRARFRQLAYRVSQGEVEAEAELAQVEHEILEDERQQRRHEAAEVEAQARAAEAEQQAFAAAREADEKKRVKALKTKESAYLKVQAATETLVLAVKAALSAGDECRAAHLRLGYSPGRTPANEITDFIAYRLGTHGADCAGLRDMPPTFPHAWKPLVEKE